MEDTNDFLYQLLEGKENQLLNKLKHCNFTHSLALFLVENGVDIVKGDILEGEKENYIDRYGTFKYKNTLKLTKYGIKIQMSCHFKTEWEFYFVEVMSPHLEIKKERVLTCTSEKMVLVFIDALMFLVPLSIAERMDLEESDGKEVASEIKKENIDVLKEFEVKSFIQIK